MSVTAESLFRDVFLPLYPEDAKSDLGRARTEDANPAGNPTVLAHLDDAARVFVEMAPVALGVPSSSLDLDFGDASVHRLSAALTPARRDALLAKGPIGSADNSLFNVVVHGSAYVGACAAHAHGATWAVRRPLWESLAHLRSAAGEADLRVFHWWLKSLADDANATLADRYRTHVEVPTASFEERTPIADPSRKLPRIVKPRYDVFYKYLRAHLPELKDVGKDFPSPERFADLGFASLSFLLAGGGRMLVVSGPNADGLHAFWLGRDGFEKSAFWPADAFPEPLLRVKEGDADKLEVVLSRDGKVQSFDTLWWGP